MINKLAAAASVVPLTALMLAGASRKAAMTRCRPRTSSLKRRTNSCKRRLPDCSVRPALSRPATSYSRPEGIS